MRSKFYFLLLSLVILLGAFFVFPGLISPVSALSHGLTVTPLTWNIIGLDSNSPLTGPRYFPVGAKVCNTSGGLLTTVNVDFQWQSANTFINLRTGSLNPIVISSLAAGACYDAYFEVDVTQNAAAFDTSRRYVITATSGAESASTPQPRELFVERLISQNRNATTDVLFGPSVANLTSVCWRFNESACWWDVCHSPCRQYGDSGL